MKKIYCKDCKYIRYGGKISFEAPINSNPYDYDCRHPNNIFYWSGDNWLVYRKREYHKYPFELNIRNKCKWYEPKEQK